jgi:hypothetical protein
LASSEAAGRDLAIATRRFLLVLVKPSHYDDEGYVIQWLRSPIPANSLACLYGLAEDMQQARGWAPMSI